MTSSLVAYHPQLQQAVLAPAPATAGSNAFLADDKLSDPEVLALDRAQSVFGLPQFYKAWELETLKPNEVQAVLHILTFYDPYTVVHDVTADPDDPDAEGADLTRALDAFGVYPGSCVYCKGQTYYESGDYSTSDAEFNAAIGASENNPAVFQRTKLLHLAHHATVQADELSPCDLRDYSEEELLALGVIRIRWHYWAPSFGAAAHSFMPSIRLTQSLLDAAEGFPGTLGKDWEPHPLRNSELLIKPGEVLSPFTHAMRAVGEDFGGRGPEQCLNAVRAIVDWDRKRYTHFLGAPEDTMWPLFKELFPQNPAAFPQWATFLAKESGGQDKGMRLMDQFRALNLPALRDLFDVAVHSDIQRFLVQYGPIYYFFSHEISTGRPLPHHLSKGPHHGVLLPSYGYFIQRNIGFGDFVIDEPDSPIKMGDLTELFHRIPDGCRLNRTGSPFQYVEHRHQRHVLEYVCPGVDSPFVQLNPAPGPHVFSDISAGRYHTCGLEESGGLVCWGSMKNGNALPIDGQFKALSSGNLHVCALHEDGTPECWGDDSAGQASPPADEKLLSISAGLFQTCGLREDGAPVCWGLGHSADPPSDEKFTSISAGEYATCGIRQDGTPVCWGNRSFWLGIYKYRFISLGPRITCGIRQDGKAWCGGLRPISDETFATIETGSSFHCGITVNGSLVCLGGDIQPGEGSYKAVSIGHEHTCAVRSDGTAECWGSNERGQASPPD